MSRNTVFEIRSGIILFRYNDAYRCPVIEHVTGPPAPNSSKKYGPRIKDAEPNTTKDLTCRGALNLPRAQTSSRWLGGAQVSLEHGSE
ncbi:hypothetical protein TNCV_1077361 [Trichonephila clavipes]|uniref:Uncharacterized protein n=1 Tax=Trichonephila clavipes TaxID=2585209 RepID=A0A8X6RVT1_TRICX|nr:hypothetical protein TNCV_1077361 [Trichonephila clavipes]